MRRDMHERAYDIEPGPADAKASRSMMFRAEHPDHALRGDFDERGLQVTPRSQRPASTVQISLDRWGRPGNWHTTTEARPRLSQNRLSFHRGELVEWYLHDSRGIEQGFDLFESPSGEGPLRVELSLDTELVPRSVDDQTVKFISHTGRQ
ncbi:MAG: hypothetical protein ACOCV2_05725, partial [Persicimonas sp.]